MIFWKSPKISMLLQIKNLLKSNSSFIHFFRIFVISLNRRLSIKYHPDRNPDDPAAATKFMLLTKAMECLKDEKSQENCESYGNPEGSGSFSVIISPFIIINKL